jgi:hypothetical protein
MKMRLHPSLTKGIFLIKLQRMLYASNEKFFHQFIFI